MLRLVAIVVMTTVSPAFAAGGVEDMSLTARLISLLALALVVGLPSIGLGFFLQGALRLKNAAAVLCLTLLLLGGVLVSSYGIDKAINATGLLAVSILVFAVLFGCGWWIGIRSAVRAKQNALLRN